MMHNHLPDIETSVISNLIVTTTEKSQRLATHLLFGFKKNEGQVFMWFFSVPGRAAIAIEATTAATEEEVPAEVTEAARRRVVRRHLTIEAEGRDEITDRDRDLTLHVSSFLLTYRNLFVRKDNVIPSLE